MQPSDREMVNRAGLLKRFLNVLCCFAPDAKHDSADETFYLGCIVQAATQRVLHPGARCLCSAQHRIAAAVPDQRAALRITSEERSTDIVPRKVSAHIEFAGVAWRADRLGGFQKVSVIAQLPRALSTGPPHLPRGFSFFIA